MTRSQPALKLAHSPLVLALAQVKISPVLQMQEYVPGIQERLRRDGFPHFRENVVQEVRFGPEIKTSARQRWVFSNKAQTETVVLASDFVALECSRYDVFEDFIGRLERLLETVRNEVEVALSDRIGLRYIDLVRPKADESLSDYLKPGLSGLPASEIGAERALHRFESIANTNVGQLVLRVLQTNDGTFLPPGLDPSDLKFDVQIGEGEILTILDIDHYSMQDRDFDPPDLIQEFWKLHDVADRVFRFAVTDHAMRRWEAKERA